VSILIAVSALTGGPVELPVDIYNDNATYEMQFGFVQRPTHKNTTWDIAKFEVCGHKVSAVAPPQLSFF
jgi:alpha-mannosidase